MSAFIIRPGDLVVCVDANLPGNPHALVMQCKDRLRQGAHYRVSAVVWLYGEKGLHLEGKDHVPTDGWRACRFRKVQGSRADRMSRKGDCEPLVQTTPTAECQRAEVC
jgi:hypothetical protein